MSWYNPLSWEGTGGRIGRGILTGGLSEAWNPSNYGGSMTDITEWAGQQQGATALPYFEQDRARLQGMLDRSGPYGEVVQAGPDQYRGSVDENLRYQRALARGEGPSLAEQSFRSASAQGLANARSLAAGGRGAQGARFAAANIGRQQAGMAAGLAEARTREMLGAQSAYNQALQGAQASAYGRDALNAQLRQQTGLANQQAYLDILAKQLGLSRDQLQAGMANSQLPTNADRVLNVVGTVGPMVAGAPAKGPTKPGTGIMPTRNY